MQDALNAREEYIALYRDDQKVDPWAEQGYHKVELSADVVIVDNIPEFDINPDANEIAIISSFGEGFGQIVRKIHAICGSEDSARNESNKVRHQFSRNFPESVEIEIVTIGHSLSDEKALNMRPRV